MNSPSSPAPWLKAAVFVAATFLMLACAGFAWLVLVTRGPAPTPAPMVYLNAPREGAMLPLHQPVIVHAVARGEGKITRLELWLDDGLLAVRRAAQPGGVSPLPLVTTWTPAAPGMHVLIVRAFDAAGQRAQAMVRVQVAAPAESAPPPDAAPGDRDGDTIADAEDACPDEAGLAEAAGCPDRDGDSVADATDWAPDEPGPVESYGAPDMDGDTVPDARDLRPEEPGPPESGGAPPGPDRDGDGAPDDADPCPDEAGAPEHDFCPPPSEAPAEPSLPPGGGRFFLPDVHPSTTVEVHAYTFEVNDDYDRLWCYVRVGDLPPRRYDFSPQGARRWEIADALAEASFIRLAADPESPLPVHVDCMASQDVATDWGTSYTLVDLGNYDYAHPRSDWNGRELIAGAAGFLGHYRICQPTCQESPLPPPITAPLTTPPGVHGPMLLSWRWDGNENDIDGFMLVVNGTAYPDVVAAPDRRAFEVSRFRPLCGTPNTFQVQAFRGNPHAADLIHSPASNPQTWDVGACPRTVAVTFRLLDMEGAAHDYARVKGTLFANDAFLLPSYRAAPPSFDASNRFNNGTRWVWQHGHIYPLPQAFGDIRSDAAACVGGGCSENYAPESATLEIPLADGEDLVLGGQLISEDAGTFFDARLRIPAEEVAPRYYYLEDNGIRLSVGVRVLVGPAAGGARGLPDLTITDLTANDAGQLQTHVFNRAADLVNQRIEVAYFDASTNALLHQDTYENLTIPSGGERILQTAAFAHEPYNLKVVIRLPDAEEVTEANNTYETPVQMRVEITAFRADEGQPCESWLASNYEFYFWVMVGHRAPDGEITWLYRLRHPEHGVVNMDSHLRPYPPAAWHVEGNPRYMFDVTMPADHELVVAATGYEDDPGLSADDYAGRVFAHYGRGENYGAQTEAYRYASTGWQECHEVGVSTSLYDSPFWRTHNFQISWRITRVH